MISDMDYLRKIAFDGVKDNEPISNSCRNDVFVIKTFCDKDARKIILNENKLESIYK
jgi:hypothetical protein